MPSEFFFSERPSYTATSIHQTPISKALFEHCERDAIENIAAVASVSPSFRHSSLGPNLLALLGFNFATVDLFTKVFLPENSTLPFTNSLQIQTRDREASAFVGMRERFCQHLPHRILLAEFVAPICRSKYLSRSLKKLEIEDSRDGFAPALCFFEGFPGIETFHWDGYKSRGMSKEPTVPVEVLETGSSLPNLSSLHLAGHFESFEEHFFRGLGDLENNTKLTSLTLNLYVDDYWNLRNYLDHDAFQLHFCQRLLGKNRLLHLDFSQSNPLPNDMVHEDFVAMAETNMSNLMSCHYVPVKCILECCNLNNDGFKNLRKLTVEEVNLSDRDLIAIGNQCRLLKELETEEGRYTGSFLQDESLDIDAFTQIEKLVLASEGIVDDSCGDGFSRFVSLKHLSVQFARNFSGAALAHLPHPEDITFLCLGSCGGVNAEFAKNVMSKFVSLEELQFWGSSISGQDLLLCVDGGAKNTLSNLKELTLTDYDAVMNSKILVSLLKHSHNLENVDIGVAIESNSYWYFDDVLKILENAKSTIRNFRFFNSNEDVAGSGLVDVLKRKFPGCKLRCNFEGSGRDKEAYEKYCLGTRREREE